MQVEYFKITPLKLKNHILQFEKRDQISNYTQIGDNIYVKLNPVCSMQLATDQYVAVNVQLDKYKKPIIYTSPHFLYQDPYIDFVKLEKIQPDIPEIDYKQIGDRITFEELVATEFQFPTAMSCDGYLAVQSLDDGQQITEQLIEQWYKNAVYLQQDQKDDLEYLGRQKFQIVLVQEKDEIFHFEASEFSDLLEQKSMMTSLSLAVRQLTQKIYNQLREDTDEYLKRFLPNNKFFLNVNYLVTKNELVSFNDYIYPLNLYQKIDQNGTQHFQPNFNGSIKLKSICNAKNSVVDAVDKYEFYVNIESKNRFEDLHVTQLHVLKLYPTQKIITNNTITAMMLLKIGISLLKMQYINEAEIIFNEAAKLVEIQDVILHYFTQLYLFFISQLRQQQIDKVKIYKLIKNTLILTCAGLGNVAIGILNYIQRQFTTLDKVDKDYVSKILEIIQNNIPQID
ncbi:Hypothetical_protein [Hexamita inflata]|uniref:Hypothetical_protein n=1 Tax=Hexamita inflata TaxID=28002 RepID=A0AA86NEE6_9EUKA|nr:Hypothetical protein HINF_LOCUS5211 [Hexamita inflata]